MQQPANEKILEPTLFKKSNQVFKPSIYMYIKFPTKQWACNYPFILSFFSSFLRGYLHLQNLLRLEQSLLQ